MKREEMTRLVNEDLKHIPRMKLYDTQADLRLTYNALRRRDLALGKSQGRNSSGMYRTPEEAKPFVVT